MTSGLPHKREARSTMSSRFHKHHTVPREILGMLPDDVARNPLVRGGAGAPNGWAIPEVKVIAEKLAGSPWVVVDAETGSALSP